MAIYHVRREDAECTIRARNHRAAARSSGMVTGGVVVKVDGPLADQPQRHATIFFYATTHSSPHLRQRLTYEY